MSTEEVPPGFVKNEDGCICPAKEEIKTCGPKFETCPHDPRFPNTNQTAHCYFSFVDYQRCARLLGEDYPGCFIFYKCYTALCPVNWYEKWFEQMEKGNFPRKIYPPKPIIRPDPKKMTCMPSAAEEQPSEPVC